MCVLTCGWCCCWWCRCWVQTIHARINTHTGSTFCFLVLFLRVNVSYVAEVLPLRGTAAVRVQRSSFFHRHACVTRPPRLSMNAVIKRLEVLATYVRTNFAVGARWSCFAKDPCFTGDAFWGHDNGTLFGLWFAVWEVCRMEYGPYTRWARQHTTIVLDPLSKGLLLMP